MNEQPASQKQIANLESQIKAIKKQLGSLEESVEDVKKDVAIVQDQNITLDKKQTELIRNQEESRIREIDTNKNAHEAKHGMLNVRANQESFKQIYEDTQKSIRQNQESIQQLFPMKAIIEKMNAWMEGFQGLETMEGWREMMKEHRENTDARKGKTSVRAAIANAAVLMGAILTAIALAKALGLFK